MRNGRATLENGLAVLYKLNVHWPSVPSNPMPGCLAKWSENIFHTKICVWLLAAIIRKCPRLKTIQMASGGWKGKQKVIRLYNGIEVSTKAGNLWGQKPNTAVASAWRWGKTVDYREAEGNFRRDGTVIYLDCGSAYNTVYNTYVHIFIVYQYNMGHFIVYQSP